MSVVAPDPVTTDWVPLGYGAQVVTNKPSVRVSRSAVQSIPNVVETQIAFDVERYDTDNMHDNATNNTRLYCRTAGRYTVKANIGVQSNATGTRQIAIRVNDGAQTAVANQVGSAADQAYMFVEATLDLQVGDWVTCTIYQNSGGALNVLQSPNYTPEFSMIYEGPALVSPVQDLLIPQPVQNGKWVKGVGGAAVWATPNDEELYYGTLGALGPTGISANPGDVILNIGNITFEPGAHYHCELTLQGVYSSTNSGGALYFGIYDVGAAAYWGGVACVSLAQGANFGWSGHHRVWMRNAGATQPRNLQLRWFAGAAGTFGVSGGGTGVSVYCSIRKG